MKRNDNLYNNSKIMGKLFEWMCRNRSNKKKTEAAYLSSAEWADARKLYRRAYMCARVPTKKGA